MHYILDLDNSNLRTIQFNGEKHLKADTSVDIGDKIVIFLKGYVHIGEDFILSESELERYVMQYGVDKLYLAEGSFACAIYWQSKIHVITDCFGLSAIYYFDGSRKVVSTSYFGLIEYLSQRVNLQFNSLYTKYFSKRLDITDCCFSRELLVKNTYILSIFESIEYRLSDHEFSLVNRKPLFDSELVIGYEEAITRGVRTLAQKIKFGRAIGKHCVVSLSGGIDSRLIFSACKGNIEFKTLSAGNSEDVSIAKRISNIYDIENISRFEDTDNFPVSPNAALRRWEYDALGTYSFLNVSNSYNMDPFRNVEIRGIGGEVLRGFYNNVERELGANEEMTECFIAGCPTDHDYRHFEWRDYHYLMYRNRIHGGRTVDEAERALFRIDPLINRFFYIAARVTDRDSRLKNKVLCDLQMVLNKELLFLAYDKKEKNIRPSQIKNSVFFRDDLNVNLFNTSIKIHGDKLAGYNSISPRDQKANWLPPSIFIEGVFNEITGQIRGEMGRNLLAMSEVEKGPNEYTLPNMAERGRQLARFYALSKLIELGVTGYQN
jgi:hypothetical protein